MGVAAQSRTRLVAAFDRARAWCAPLAPPALTRVAGYDGSDAFRRRVRIVADFASPTRLAIFGRETIPAGVLVSLAAAAAGFVADRRAAATRSIVAPIVTQRVARRLDVVVDATDGSVVVRDDLETLLECASTNARPRGDRRETKETRAKITVVDDVALFRSRANKRRAASIAVVRRVHAGLGGLVAVAPRTIAAPYLDPADATPKTFSSAAAAWFADVEGDDATADAEDIVGTYRRRKKKNASDAAIESSESSELSDASCLAWTLAGARVRRVDRAVVVRRETTRAERGVPATNARDSGSRSGSGSGSGRRRVASLELNNQVMLRLIRWFSSAFARSSASASSASAESDEIEDAGPGDADQADADAAAETLARILEILRSAPRPEGADPIRADTNLLEAGFDSLQIVELRRRLEEAGPPGFALSPNAVVEHPTPAALVERMRGFARARTSRHGRGMRTVGNRSDAAVVPGRPGATASTSQDRDFPRATAFGAGVLILILSVMCAVLAAALLMQSR